MWKQLKSDCFFFVFFFLGSPVGLLPEATTQSKSPTPPMSPISPKSLRDRNAFCIAGATESHTFHSPSKEDVRSGPEPWRLAVLSAAADRWGALCGRVTGDFILRLSNPASPRISEAALPLLCPAPIPPPRRRIPSLAAVSLGRGHVTHPFRPSNHHGTGGGCGGSGVQVLPAERCPVTP